MKVTGMLGIWSHLVRSGTDRQYYRLVHKDICDRERQNGIPFEWEKCTDNEQSTKHLTNHLNG